MEIHLTVIQQIVPLQVNGNHYTNKGYLHELRSKKIGTLEKKKLSRFKARNAQRFFFLINIKLKKIYMTGLNLHDWIKIYCIF